MNWEDLINMGFRDPEGQMPSVQNPMVSQLMGMMRTMGMDNAAALAEMFRNFLDMMSEFGYGVNLAVSPDGDAYGLMAVELNPDHAGETKDMSANPDRAFVASFGPGSVDRMAALAQRIRNNEL